MYNNRMNFTAKKVKLAKPKKTITLSIMCNVKFSSSATLGKLNVLY